MIRLRRCWIVIAIALMGNCEAICLASSAEKLPEQEVIMNYSEEVAKKRIDELGPQPIEGLWYYAEEQTTLAIERYKDLHDGKAWAYRVIYVDSEDYDVLPGSVMGYIEESVDEQKYSLWLYSARKGAKLSKPVKCVATLNKEKGTLMFEKSKMKLRFRVNVARFLPTLFKGISIVPSTDKETLPVGFRKIYPVKGDNDINTKKIRYL